MISEAIRLKIVRAILDMNQREFARAIGASNASVCCWEAGKTSLSRATRVRLHELCEASGIMFLPTGYPILKSEIMPVAESAGPKIESEDFSECLKRASESA